MCLFIYCIWLFNSSILINRINASIKLLLPNIHTLSHGIRAFKINGNQSVQNQQKSERSRSLEIKNQSVQNQQKLERSTTSETTTKEIMATVENPDMVVDTIPSSTSISRSIRIDRLTEATNYHPWQIRMKMYLRRLHLWAYIYGSKAKPEKENDRETHAWQDKDFDA